MAYAQKDLIVQDIKISWWERYVPTCLPNLLDLKLNFPCLNTDPKCILKISVVVVLVSNRWRNIFPTLSIINYYASSLQAWTQNIQKIIQSLGLSHTAFSAYTMLSMVEKHLALDWWYILISFKSNLKCGRRGLQPSLYIDIAEYKNTKILLF